MDYDLKITGGLLVDGTGAPGRRADVAIKDGRIVALGEAPGSAAREIDAAGRVVCPGFIDVHTHYDAQVIWDRGLSISPWHGVTTVVMGNCGFGIAPVRKDHRQLLVQTLEKVEGMSGAALREGLGDWGFETFPEYLDVIEKRGTAINVAALVGHTPLRLYVMGEEATEREATDDEVAAMRRIQGVPCPAARPVTTRSNNWRPRCARPATACCRPRWATGCCWSSSRSSRARTACRSAGRRCWPGPPSANRTTR
ncbi:MAG: hypothetical protein EOO24_20920 [Comamonadaceae bacterium]|nr:MAG: hypothetical protein EOO24_20920 [Comamonadaceae bacterium]